MKNKFLYIPALAMLLAVVLLSCKKNAVQIIDSPPNGALVKFFNFSVGSPVVNFYAGDVKIAGAVSTTGAESATAGIGYGNVFPATNNYSVLPPGTYDIKAKRPSTATADPGLVVATQNITVATGKMYSLYLAGIYDGTAKKAESFVIEDALPAIDTSAAQARLINTVSNAPALNLVAKNTTTGVETILATNVAYKSASAFQRIPSGVYDLILRNNATSATVFTRTGVSMIKANTYSFSFRGNFATTSTYFLDNTPNR